MDAVKDSVLPLHIGLLLPVIGVAGVEGSVKLTGPITLDGQPKEITEILS